MGEAEVILRSNSWEKNGEPARQKHLETVMQKAGLEIVKKDEAVPEPKPEELNENLTPQERVEQSLRNYGQQLKTAKTKYPDFEKTVKQDIFIGVETQHAIIQQPNGADVVFYLGQHPEYARKLGKMCKTGSAISAVREVERLSTRLGGNTPAPQRRPVRPPENASFQEIAETPNYPGKARDLRRALAKR